MTDGINKNDGIECNEKFANECDNEISVAAQIESISEGNEPTQNVCEQCGSTNIEDDYRLNLCMNCRDELSKFRIPIWVKGFAILVMAILVAALMKFPNTLNAGISYERAIKFEQEKKYLSAMREYEKVVNTYPDSTTALSKLFITQYRTGRIGYAAETYDKLVGRDVDDELLFNEISSILEQLNSWYSPSKAFNDLMNASQNYDLEQVRDKVIAFVNNNPKETFASLDLASILMSTGETEKAKEVALGVLKEYPDFIDCSFLLGAIYRETGEYDKAIELYNRILESNVERADAYSAIARIELKRGNDKAGLDMAARAYNIDDSDSFIVSNLVLAYHFNNMVAERDKLFDTYKNQENYSKNDYELITSIINGTNDEWRD